MRVLRGVLRGGLVGAVFGVLARLVMRFVALLMGEEVEFDLVASSLIVSLFVLSGAGAGLAAAAGLRTLAATLVVAASSVLLLLMGGAIGIGETVAGFDKDLGAARTVGVLAAAGVIAALTLATPYVGWRLGRAARLGSLA